MKALKILIVMLIFIMSVGAVCAAESVTGDMMEADNDGMFRFQKVMP